MLRMIDYSNATRRDILCVDVRSFFASVEAVTRGLDPLEDEVIVLSNPHLEGGLVLAASPKVKQKYGLTTGSRRFEFPRDTSSITIVEPRMALYLDYNLKIQHIFQAFVAEEDIHPYSIDECFLDVTHSRNLFGSAEKMAHQLSKRIKEELGLIVTIGIGENPLLAKLALDNEAKHSPDSNYIAKWTYEDVPKKVWNIEPLTDMWGIGRRMANNLNKRGIYSVYDLAQTNPRLLEQQYGVIGLQLFFHAHGIDESILSNKYNPKSNSFSKNQILDRDYTSQEEIETVIKEMVEENATRLRSHQATTSVIHLSIGYSKHAWKSGFSHQLSIPATQSTKTLQKEFILLFKKHYDREPVRTINVTFGKIKQSNHKQLSLFDSYEKTRKEEQLENIIDYLRRKYGYTSILHASSLLKGSTVKKRAKLLGGHKA